MKCLYLWNLLLLYGLYHCRLLSPLHFMVMLHFFKAEIPRCQFSVERYLKKKWHSSVGISNQSLYIV